MKLKDTFFDVGLTYTFVWFWTESLYRLATQSRLVFVSPRSDYVRRLSSVVRVYTVCGPTSV